MEKNYIRSNQANGKGLSSDSKKNQDVSKPLPRNSRRRETTNCSNTKSEPLRNTKPSTSATKTRYNNYNDKRPRHRGGYQGNNTLELSSSSSTGLEYDQGLVAEVNSVFIQGSKKQNLNHLLNFHYVPRERDHPQNFVKTGNNRGYVKKHTYNKEHYLQANCQFVVKSDVDYSPYIKSPDTLVGWENIEQINIQSSEEPQCPICLFPPIAGKMTKCGHVFCWPCILHYLALSDKSWRKCPICYESVHSNDLKSAVSKPYRNYNIGDTVTLQLMRREKGCLNISKANTNILKTYKFPHLSDSSIDAIHSKLLLANNDEIRMIIDRERRELDAQFISDGDDCPESIFIQQALELLKTRQDGLQTFVNKSMTNINEYGMSDKMDVNEETASVCSSSESEKSSFIIDEDTNLTIQDIDIVPVSDISKYFFFYQAADGQHLYLHSINVRMLQTMFGSLENSPTIITGKIVQRESCSMSIELRRRLKYLDHLPVTCQFDIVEIQFDNHLISSDVFDRFKDELLLRKKQRQRRAREERVREKRIFEVNERQLGKVLAESAKIDIDSTQHFPSCGRFDATLSPTSSLRDDFLDNFNTSLSLNSEPPGFSSSPTTSGPSFATMLANAPKPTWPTLGQSKSAPSMEINPPQKITQITGSKCVTIFKVRKNRCPQEDSDDNIDEIDNPRVPEFKQSFSAAIAEALQKANISNKKNNETQENCSNGGKKKKNKKTVLFSTGMAFNGVN